jgi:signal transduction histidine kinase
MKRGLNHHSDGTGAVPLPLCQSLLVALLLCLLVQSKAWAESSPLFVDPLAAKQSMLDHGMLWEEVYSPENPPSSVDQVLALPLTAWSPVDKSSVFKGLSVNRYWYRVRLGYTGDHSLSRLLQFERELTDEIDVYLFQNQDLKADYHLGSARPLSQRPIKQRAMLIPLTLEPHSYFDLLVSFDSRGDPLQMKINLWQPERYYEQQAREDFYILLYFGGVLALVLYNLFLWISVRIRAYGYYILYSLCFVYAIASSFGFPQMVLAVEQPLWNQLGFAITPVSTRFFLYLFLLHFLSLPERFPRLALFIRVVMTLEFLAVPVMVFALLTDQAGLYLSAYQWAIKFLIVHPPLCVFVGIYVLSKGHREARYYTIAMGLLLLSVMLHALNMNGYSEFSFSTVGLIMVAQYLEMLLLSFALADRINLIQQNQTALLKASAERERELVLARDRELEAKQHVVEALAQANVVKEGFLRNISHELRTPMHAIQGGLQLMQTSPSQRLSEPLDVVQHGADEMMALVNDLLTYTELQAGRAILDEKPCETRAFFAYLENRYRAQCEQKGLTLCWQLDSDLPSVLLFDREKWRIVLVKLLDNAVKFTPSGSVNVTLDYQFGGGASRDSNKNICLPGEDENGDALAQGRVHIQIKDTGIGMSESDREHVFDLFHQTQAGRLPLDATVGVGVGIGMRIVKYLMRLLQGELSMRSELNQGS